MASIANFITMKKFILLFLFFFVTFLNAQKNHFSEIKTYQKKLNDSYANKSQSPLEAADLKTFKGLPFFAVSEKYTVKATLVLTPKAPIFVMKTSTKRKPLYQQYAIATFFIDGKKQELRIYQSQESKFNLQYKDYLFIPFKDKTNGSSTYGGGRFIDLFISDIKNNEIIIDFNKAYNPYCAYNHNYSCPIPPFENHLKIAIYAGVKNGLLKK